MIPAGFSEAIAHGLPAELRVIGNVDASIGTQVAQSIAQSFADATDTARIVVAATGVGTINGRLVASLPTPIAIADVSTRNRQLDAGTFYAAGMAVFFLFFTVQFGSRASSTSDGTGHSPGCSSRRSARAPCSPASC